MEEKSNIEQLFDDAPKKSVGNKREVWDTELTEGEDTVHLMVKERQSDDEVEILSYLYEMGVGEQLVSYDDKKLVIEKCEGSFLLDHIVSMIDRRPDKIVEASTITKGTPRFRIKAEERISLPVSAIEDEEVGEFVGTYIADLIFLELSGIFHKDIKLDNVLVSDDGRIEFIDFGEAEIVGKGTPTPNAAELFYKNLADGLVLVQSLHPPFKEVVQNLRREQNVLPALVQELYAAYQEKESPLSERPPILKQYLADGQGYAGHSRLSDVLASLGFPAVLAENVAEKVSKMVATKLG